MTLPTRGSGGLLIKCEIAMEDKMKAVQKKNGYNISPSRYIHTTETETYRPIKEIVDELEVIETEARETDKALKGVLARIME